MIWGYLQIIHLYPFVHKIFHEINQPFLDTPNYGKLHIALVASNLPFLRVQRCLQLDAARVANGQRGLLDLGGIPLVNSHNDCTWQNYI